MAERDREELSASFSRLLRTLSSASMSRRPLCPPLSLLHPLPVHQNEMESTESTERCCSSCSDESNNNGEERETEPGELESKEEGGEGEQDELELKRDSTVNVNVVRANFKCNDMECSLVLGDYVNGFLGSFLSKGLKTNQLVVNTDEKTLRPVARLKEPRDLFALPKDKDNDCSQQAPRWPVECQVIEERITHIPYVPATPEPLNAPTGNELKPRPVGEENGIVVFSYSPISAVNYEKPKAKKEEDESSDESDYSSDSRQDSTPPSRATPMRLAGGGGCARGKLNSVSKMINNVDNRSTSASLDDNDDYYDDEYDTSGGGGGGSGEAKEKAIIKDLIEAKKKRYQEEAATGTPGGGTARNSRAPSRSEASKDPSDIDDIWKNNTSEYKPASPRYVLSQFGKNVAKAVIDRIVDYDDPAMANGAIPPSGSQKVSNKFAITPIKLPKTNIARLEVAFERSARQDRTTAVAPKSHSERVIKSVAVVHGQRTGDSTSSEDTSSSGLGEEEEYEFDSDTEDSGSGDALRRTARSNSARLAGGAEKRPCPGSGSVSDTETLVGDESRSRLAGSGDPQQQAYVRSRSRQSQVRLPFRAVPHTHAATVAAAAASAAALARGRHRDKDGCLSGKDESSKGGFYDMSMGMGAITTGTSMGTTRTSSPVGNNVFRLSKDQQQQLLHSMASRETTDTLNSTSTNQMTTTTTTSSQSFPCSDFPQAQFSRSAVGGARFVTNCHPMNPEEYDGLEFESRFESGNLAKAVQITPTYYELYLRPDLYTSRSKQWFYFRVRRTRRKMLYRFSIVNLVKSDSLYNDGMQPVMYSTLGAKDKSEGWRRCGDNICYYRNDDESASNSANEDDEDNSTYTLTFTIEFEQDDDTVFFAHSYPYTYSDLQDYLMEIQRHPVKSKFCKLRLLCRTLAGNNVYYLTVTAPSSNEENMRRKKSIVVSARVHPSETPASWMMKGLMDFITGDTTVAKRLRHKFIFKLVPMLNPDGVIVGNTRNSLTGKDLNRQYRTVIRETYPSIWYTKAMIRRLIEECGVAMYCDMHAHSRKHNIFIYGCENKRNPEKKLTEQVFPLMLHKNSADRFSFESCKFKIQRSKEGTGRIVVWMLGITNSYTIEASFGGSSLGSRKGTHFNTQDYEHMGRAFCETLLDYCDENPNKVKRHAKLFKQIKKIRKREKREQKALKLQKMADQILNLLKQQDRLRSKIIERLMREGSSADEPLNIPLSDYSSDEGNCSSSSDNEGKHSITASDLEGPCCAPTRAPPSSPEVIHEIRKFRMRRMRKVMHELDRIYFTPLFQRKFKTLTTLKRRRHKMGGKATPNGKRLRGGGAGSGVGVGSNAIGDATPTPTTAAQAGGSLMENTTASQQQNSTRQLAKKPPIKKGQTTGAQSSDSTDSLDSSQSESFRDPDCSSASTGTSKEVKRKVKANSAGAGGGAKKTGKKKKFMPTEKKKQVVNQKLHVDRNFRLWLANRRIYIYRRKKSTQARRTKVRSKPPKKRGEVVRTTLDLPTTDPGSDLHFSTDDEEHSPTTGQNGYGAVAPLRHTLLQSDLQRRYIEEIGDTVVQKPKPAHMPPELIVTTPSKSGTPGGGKKLDVYKLTPRTAPELDTGGHHMAMMQRQPGGAGTSARRTYSWHNLDQQEIPSGSGGQGKANFYMGESKPAMKAMAKPPPRRSVPSNFIPQRHGNVQTADDLQLKLSLKKKVWTGAHGDADGRPLAWYKGHSIAGSQMANTATAIRSAGGGGGGGGGAAGAGGGVGAGGSGHNRAMFTTNGREAPAASGGIAIGVPPSFIGAPRRPRKLEQVDLFNACSQKLLLWQQQEEHKRSQPQPAQRLMKVEDSQQQPPHSRDRDRERDREQHAFKPLHMAKKSAGTSQSKVIQALVAGDSGGKVKRRSSSMMKIAETTQLVTRFARSRNSAGGSAVQQQLQQQQMHQQHQRMMFKGQVGAGSMSGRMHSAGVMGHMQSNGGGGRAPNKFKTGGLVITAVQQPTNMPGGSSRRMRNAAGLQTKSSTGALGSSSGQMQYQRSNGNVQANKSSTGISLDTVNLVRKVKTKLKKRKSRTLSNGAPKQ
ncbi:cytosolic carboxypeptidase Nna1 isoform X3 [Drosophila rhopaloa]|uniref:Cytosolic carboxypeptidase NnaD isoform X3 n=1 Tax=Drosophila rhopaloa TaxID=1041015 RepID=A0A6P4DZ06_DRORH|nr:cytosolic carboxypeptidase Nna1 isoform X3 [Drosophila rhopaloa]